MLYKQRENYLISIKDRGDLNARLIMEFTDKLLVEITSDQVGGLLNGTNRYIFKNDIEKVSVVCEDCGEG